MDKKTVKKEFKKRKKELSTTYKHDKKELKSGYHDYIDHIGKAGEEKHYVDPPKRSALEEIGNAVTHGVGALFAVLALVLMCVAADRPVEYVGAALYSAGQLLMFTMSCLYHSFRHGGKTKRLFRRFDYSGIYLLIGATFAPILLCYSQSSFSLLFFIIQWAIIAFGISFVGIFGPAKFRAIHIPLYVLLGWCGLFFIPEMLTRGDFTLFGLVLGGGVLYSLGIIPFAMKGRAAHFIWHFFVLAGAVVQWLGIYLNIYLV